MNLIFLHGAPAVGKLTIARELADLTGLRLFHNHLTVDLVNAVFDFGSEPFVILREQIWLAVFREAAQQNVSLIFTFSPESSVRERFIQDAIETVESAGGKVIFVELTCSSDELERRMESPSRSQFGKLRFVEQYQELKQAGAFEFAKLPDSGASFDTTDRNPKETAAVIKASLSRLT
jgi:chloramphenicol 3-O-phosphotransferase